MFLTLYLNETVNIILSNRINNGKYCNIDNTFWITYFRILEKVIENQLALMQRSTTRINDLRNLNSESNGKYI